MKYINGALNKLKIDYFAKQHVLCYTKIATATMDNGKPSHATSAQVKKCSDELTIKCNQSKRHGAIV